MFCLNDWREKSRNNKVLEASNLRAFYKLYIIGS